MSAGKASGKRTTPPVPRPGGLAEKADGLGRRAESLRRLAGWRQLGLAALLGALAAGALPPLYLVPLLVPAFVGLVWLLEGCAGWRRAFLVGWAFAVGHHFVGLYWVGIAMTVDLARFWWFMPIAVGGLAFGLGLFVALAAALVRGLGLRGPSLVLGLTAAWLLGEAARGYLLSGFPWNLLGTVWAFDALPLQAASLFGVWGLSAVTLLAAMAPASLAQPSAGGARAGRIFAALAVVPLALCLLFGALRLLPAPPAGAEVVPDARLRLVQPSISQQEKWLPTQRERHVEQQLEMSRRPGFEQVRAVIWAETAVPFLLNGDPHLQAVLGRAAPPDGLLITGAPSLEPVPDGPQDALFNSLYAIRPTGAVAARFDKVHLVPFGEYLPLRGLLGRLGFAGLAAGQRDFGSGPGRRTLALEGLPPFSPLICYEVIFPGRVYPREGPRPAWLLNITNDAWFSRPPLVPRSSGPYQHFASARLRTVEEGLPLVRAANNGISAIIDPYGRILARLPLNAVDTLDAALPRALAPTLFSRLGNWVLVPLLLLLALPAALLRNRC